jgi:DNA-binding response OmpR family regulator
MQKIKVALIEDEPFLASMYKTKLELEGFEVQHASDGEAGLKLVSESKPDLILLDVVMPKMDGFEVLTQLRANVDTGKLPVILLTNLGQRADIEKGLQLGATDYIIKANYTPAQVVAKVKEHLNIST